MGGIETRFKRGNQIGKDFRFKKGQISYNRGKTLSEETKKKIYTLKRNKNISFALKGKKRKHLSEEHKRKISLSLNGRIPSSSCFTKERRSKLIIPVKDSSIEVKIQNYLKELNIDFFTHQHIKEIEHGYQCDILIPYMNLIIECDGDYWHHYPIGREIDHIRTRELIEKGFKVLRLWEFEINQMSLDKFKERISWK